MQFSAEFSRREWQTHQLQILLPVDRKILAWGSLKQKDFSMMLPILMATLMLGLHKGWKSSLVLKMKSNVINEQNF